MEDNDEDVMNTMRGIDEALGTGSGQRGAVAAISNPCDAYNKIRDLLPTLIALAGRIPVVGKRIAAALTLLQMIGDQFCPKPA